MRWDCLWGGGSYGKLDAGLLGRGKREDMCVRAVVDTLQHGQIGYDAARVEILETLIGKKGE